MFDNSLQSKTHIANQEIPQNWYFEKKQNNLYFALSASNNSENLSF